MDKGRAIDGAIDLRKRAGKPSGDNVQEEGNFCRPFNTVLQEISIKSRDLSGILEGKLGKKTIILPRNEFPKCTFCQFTPVVMSRGQCHCSLGLGL